MEVLHIWTLYDKPTDFPHCAVARRFVVGKDDQTGESYQGPTDNIIVAPTVDELRNVMRAKHLTCIGRMREDEPQIVECWV